MKHSHGRSRGRSRSKSPRAELASKTRNRAAKHQEHAKVLRGRVQKHPRGFAFLLPEDRTIADSYLSEEQAQTLMDDDVVEYRMSSRGGRPSAELVKIVSRRRTEVVGRTQFVGRDRTLGLVTPEGMFFHVRSERGAPPAGQWVHGQIEKYPSEKGAGEVIILETLGSGLEPKHDVRIAAARFSLATVFTDGALRDAGLAKKRMEEELRTAKRSDYTQVPLVTIDGEDAKDFDDAVAVEEGPDGEMRLVVAIADVAFFVRPGDALDEDARKRATSVYFPGAVIPMLPEALSNDLCSLRPKETRLSMVAEIDFDHRGRPLRTRFANAVIRTHARLTYAQLQAYADGDPAVRKELAHLDGAIGRLQKLYRILEQRRRERGVLDFDLPEAKVEVDSQGRPVRLGLYPKYETNKWIEEFMIAANSAVARELREKNEPALYRVHEAPSPEALETANQKLKMLGFGQRVEEADPMAFATVLRATAGKDGYEAAHFALLRAQSQAKYEAEPMGHFGLALRDYAHFTSPIRRYPDLVVHRALKAVIAGKKKSDTDLEEEWKKIDDLGRWTSDRERSATEAERYVKKRKQCWWFQERLGEEYDGRVNGANPRGLFITLGDTQAEGFLPIDSLPGQWAFDEHRASFVAKPGGQILGFGFKLKVQIVRVSVDETEIELAMAGQAAAKSPREKILAKVREGKTDERREDRRGGRDRRSTERPGKDAARPQPKGGDRGRGGRKPEAKKDKRGSEGKKGPRRRR